MANIRSVGQNPPRLAIRRHQECLPGFYARVTDDVDEWCFVVHWFTFATISPAWQISHFTSLTVIPASSFR